MSESVVIFEVDATVAHAEGRAVLVDAGHCCQQGGVGGGTARRLAGGLAGGNVSRLTRGRGGGLA